MKAKQIFVNLPVKNLKKTKEFFTRIGFKFNPQFTDENAACMIIGKNIFSMLIGEKMFKTFIKKKIANTKEQTEVLLAISLKNKREVNQVMEKAVAAGGKEAREAQDHGWMYAKCFEDLDGHIWEIFCMDASAMPKKSNKK